MTNSNNEIEYIDFRFLNHICHPILKKSEETESIKTTFPRFFVPASPRHNPAFTKPLRPIPTNCRFSSRSPIRKNRPHLGHTKVVKTVEFSKSLKRILHRATVLVLNANFIVHIVRPFL